MAKVDLYNNLALVHALAPQTINTSTTTESDAIDLAGYEGALICFHAGAIAGSSSANVLLPLITECDTSGGSYTAVADADLIGTEAAAAHNGGTDSTVTKIGYVGAKRYIKVALVSTATTTAGALVAATVIKGAALVKPVA